MVLKLQTTDRTDHHLSAEEQQEHITDGLVQSAIRKVNFYAVTAEQKRHPC
jgi:hypothetical protein